MSARLPKSRLEIMGKSGTPLGQNGEHRQPDTGSMSIGNRRIAFGESNQPMTVQLWTAAQKSARLTVSSHWVEPEVTGCRIPE